MSDSSTPVTNITANTSRKHSSSRVVSVAAIQFTCSDDVEHNLQKAEKFVTQAANEGANIILLQELFASLYFPIDQVDCSDLAVSQDDDNTFLTRFQNLAKSLKVVLPVSFFERCKYVFCSFFPLLFSFYFSL